MNLTTRDLGVRVEEFTERREYHLHAVDGLQNGLEAMIIEERGVYRAFPLKVNIAATARQHDSLESALDELRAYALELAVTALDEP